MGFFLLAIKLQKGLRESARPEMRQWSMDAQGRQVTGLFHSRGERKAIKARAPSHRDEFPRNEMFRPAGIVGPLATRAKAEKGQHPRLRVCKSSFEKQVPEVGVEPTRAEAHWILSPARLPFRHSGNTHRTNRSGIDLPYSFVPSFIPPLFVPSSLLSSFLPFPGEPGDIL